MKNPPRFKFYLLWTALAIFMMSCTSKPNFDELICVTLSTGSSFYYFFADTLGNVVTKPQEGLCGDFHEGLAYTHRITKQGYFCGYINKQGKMVIPLKYKDAGNFINGFAKVSTDFWKQGMINTKGEEIIPCMYPSVDVIGKNGLHKVTDTIGNIGCFNESGEMVYPCEYSNIAFLKNGNIYFAKRGKGKFIRTTKNDTIWLNQYREIDFNMNDTLAKVRNDQNLYGLIDMNGIEVIPCEYRFLGYFNNEGWSEFNAIDGTAGWIHYSGKKITMDLDRKQNFSEGLASIRKKGENLYGYINTDGDIVIPPRFLHANPFTCGFAYVCTQQHDWVYIDKQGNVQDTVYLDDLSSPHENLEDIDIIEKWIKEKGKWGKRGNLPKGCRSKDGKVIVPCEYKFIKKHPHWIEAITTDDKHYIYSPEGNLYFKY